MRLLFCLSVAAAALGSMLGCSSPAVAEAEKPPVVASPEAGKAQELAAQGTKIMTDPKLKPSEKYPQALELYRQALALDPENAEARGNKAMIESIYKSMGRPVPGEGS